jgi:hypothetical protein
MNAPWENTDAGDEIFTSITETLFSPLRNCVELNKVVDCVIRVLQSNSRLYGE